MIYLFNDVKELTGTVRNNHILNLLYEREKNGIYSVSAEIPVTYNDQGTIYNYNKKIQKSVFLGHYDKEGRFQLHKIAAVDIENGSIFVKGIHIFFDEAKAGAIIQDRRFINREIIDGARVAFESIGWSVTDFDVSVSKTYNFYNVTPLEARQILVETFGFEFDYWLDFDGKKVTNRHVAVKEKIGEKTNKRYTYGHNVLNIRAEQDYSEIYTAVIGRGKGEEIEETGGYGRRIEYTDVVWSKPSKPLNKPAGTRILEDPNATQLFGYKENGVVKPRIKVEVFSDIESPTELIQASYDWLMDNNVPKAVFSLKVADGDGLNLGDEVYVIYRDIDLVKSARVEKVIDDLVSGNRDVEFGDTAYFDTDRRLSGLRADLKRYSGETGDRIYRMKMEFNRRFDEEVSSWVEEFEKNLIDQQAQIEADRENMSNLIEGTRTEFTDNLNAEITQTKEYAEQQAQAKAEAVRTDLGTVTSGHQAMLDDLENNVMNIDDFLGDKTVGLNEMLINERIWFEEKLSNVDTWHYNMLRGSRFDEPAQIKMWNGSIKTDEAVPYYEYNSNPYQGWVEFLEEIQFEAGQQYTLSFDVQTLGVKKMDYTFIIASPDDGGANMPIHRVDIQDSGTNNGIFLSSQYRRYWIKFTPDRNILGTIRIGANLVNNEQGYQPFKLRLPYLTTTDNTRWLYHQLDATQNIEEITRRVMQLEDGREELITKTQFDFETGEINGTIKSVLETVDESLIIIQNHEDWVLTNGASVERTVDGFESKAWLTDIHNPNMIPHSRFLDPENIGRWTDRAAPLMTKHGDEWLQIRSTNSLALIGVESPKIPDKIISGETYTISWEAFFNISSARINYDFSYMFVLYSNSDNQSLPRPTLKETKSVTVAGTVRTVYVYEITFTANNTDNNAAILFGTNCNSGEDIRFFMRYPKLEVGAVSTPYFNAFSNLSQRADEMMLAVQGIDVTGFLSQSDIEIVPDYVQIGSQRLDGSDIGSLLRVSPTGIDIVAEALRLSGDLYVDGDITALALSAIEGNFARLFASELAADVITSDHIQVGTALIDKFFATSARIDRLITKTHFVNEMHALTLNVVDLNASQIRTRLLSANTIEASWIKSGTALLDRVFSSTAMFERMMAKSGFVTTLNTVTIDTDQITIRRPDGGMLINNGMANWDFDVQMEEFIETTGVEWNGQWYETKRDTPTRVKIGSFKHSGTQLKLNIMVRLSGRSPAASELMFVTVRSFGGSLDYNVRRRYQVYRSSSQSQEFHVNLGVPQYGASMFYLEFQRDPSGTNSENIVQVRCNRAWQEG